MRRRLCQIGRSVRAARLPLWAIVVATASCHGPTGPTPTTLAVTCPADITVESATSGTVVTYPPPTTSGGTAPVTTACDVPSGSALSFGAHPVSCTARDAASQSATCGFKITVQPIPMLRGERFLAYGDSITGGEVAPDQHPSYQSADQAYPAILQGLLRARYKAQSVLVVPIGVYGQTAAEGSQLLASTLAQHPSDAVLLLEGVNDVNQGDTPAHVAEYLAADVHIAQSAGVMIVFLSTLLPQTPCPSVSTSPCRSSPASQQGVIDTNVWIRNLAASTGTVLVDNYAALATAPTLYIGDDGLHPSVTGHQKIAETFFGAIKTNFEVPVSAVVVRTIRR